MRSAGYVQGSGGGSFYILPGEERGKRNQRERERQRGDLRLRRGELSHSRLLIRNARLMGVRMPGNQSLAAPCDRHLPTYLCSLAMTRLELRNKSETIGELVGFSGNLIDLGRAYHNAFMCGEVVEVMNTFCLMSLPWRRKTDWLMRGRTG